MHIFLTLTTIAFIVVYVEDISGFVQSVKRFIMSKLLKMQNPDPYKVHWPPFDCSRCMTLWTCLAYLLIFNNFSLYNLAFICGLSMLTPQIGALLQLICDSISAIETYIGKKIFKV